MNNSKYWDCPSCKHNKISIQETHCPFCGAVRDKSTKVYSIENIEDYKGNGWYCSYCNTFNDRNAEFCKSCGSKKEKSADYWDNTNHEQIHNKSVVYDNSQEVENVAKILGLILGFSSINSFFNRVKYSFTKLLKTIFLIIFIIFVIIIVLKFFL